MIKAIRKYGLLISNLSPLTCVSGFFVGGKAFLYSTKEKPSNLSTAGFQEYKHIMKESNQIEVSQPTTIAKQSCL